MLDGGVLRLLLLLLLSLFASSASATIYYVDSSIADTNVASATPDFTAYNPATFATTGGSASVYKTVVDVNLKAFAAGDFVLFRKGQTWRERLIIPASGSVGNVFTVDSYGSGVQPIFSGADVFANWTTETTIYYASTSIQPKQVFRDGARLVLAASKVALATGQFWWDAGSTRVYVFDNPSGHTIEVSQRIYAISGQSRNYVTIKNVEVRMANTHGLYFDGDNAILVEGATAQYNYDEGFRFDSCANSTFRSVTAAYNGADGIALYGGLKYPAPNSLIELSIAHHNAQLSDINYTAGIKLGSLGVTNAIVQNNISHDNGLVGMTGSRGAGIWADSVGAGLISRNNLIYSNQHHGIFHECSAAAEMSYNVVYNNGNNNGKAGLKIGCESAVGVHDNKITNNTAYGNYNGLIVDGPGLSGGVTNSLIKNNIVVGTTTYPLRAVRGGENPGTNGSGNVYDHNCFGPGPFSYIEWGEAVLVSTYAAWESLYGGTTNSVQTNPLLTNPGAGDLTLQSGSPVINVGANLGSTYQAALLPASTWPSGVLTGNQNSYGAGWEMGAYVFGSLGGRISIIGKMQGRGTIK